MKPLVIEVIYKGHQCPSSFYMAKSVEAVMPKYVESVEMTKIEFNVAREYACRLYELSVSLYGEEAVKHQGRLAPIPSLFFNGELTFDQIPSAEELANAIDFYLANGETLRKGDGTYEN